MKNRVAVFRETGVVTIEETEVKDPEKGELLIKILACNLCTSEYGIYSGNRTAKFPYRFGHEWTGTVVKVGEGVTGYKEGDFVGGCFEYDMESVEAQTGYSANAPRLYAFHEMNSDGYYGRFRGCAEYLIQKAGCAFHLNPDLDPAEAAFLEPVATVISGIQKLHLSPSDKVLIIGAGTMGILNALGSTTTLACRRDTPLRTYDPFVLELLMKELPHSGVNVMPNSTIERITKREDGKFTCQFQNGSIVDDVDFVLMAAGRVPLIDGLGLEIPGVSVERGIVVVNEKEETSAPGVYCLGDDIGKVDLTPVAIQAGRRLADRLFGNQPDSVMDYSNVPSVVFSHPPIATCGLTEPQAHERFGDDVQVYKTTFANSFYALAKDEEKRKTGMKLVCQKSTQKVLGVHMIGDNVDEMLQGFAVAIKMGATKKDLDSTVAIHPTAAEEVVTFAPWGMY